MAIWSKERERAIEASQNGLIAILEEFKEVSSLRFYDMNTALQAEGHPDDINRAALWYLIDAQILDLDECLEVCRGLRWHSRWKRNDNVLPVCSREVRVGYPMTYSRVINRNKLTGDYSSATKVSCPDDDGVISGDLRRLEADQRDDIHLLAYARRAGITPTQAKVVLDAFFEGGVLGEVSDEEWQEWYRRNHSLDFKEIVYLGSDSTNTNR